MIGHSYMSEAEMPRVLEALQKYGYQSQSYNVTVGQKQYFFSDAVPDGVIAYVVVAGVAIVAGDPLCAPRDIREFCADFLQFCQENGWRCAFQAVTLRTLEQLQHLRFGFLKIGDEPFFTLETFSLAGGRFRDLRRDLRRAQADGLTVVEYRPRDERKPELEAEMNALSEAWQKQKGSGEFEFLVGQPSLDDPGDRKYFLAMNDGHVEAFCVCTPVYARNGVYFDLLRRKERPVRGTVELLIIESFNLLKEQGYELATLGTAPLSGEHTNDPVQGWFIEAAMEFSFNRLGYFYSFKPIYRFKEQFGPDIWESRYLAYYPSRFNPIIIYALLKAYDPAAVRNLSRKQVVAVWDTIKWLAMTPVDTAEWLKDLPADGAQVVARMLGRIHLPDAPSIPSMPELPGLRSLAAAPHRLGRLIKVVGDKDSKTDDSSK